MKRKIAAILSSDVAGYSRLVAEDEEETLKRLSECTALFDETVKSFGGRIFNTAGDAVLAEFPSAVEALRAAIKLQEALRTQNSNYPESRKLNFRMGLTIGDVVESGTDLLGDGVNISARLQGLAEPGSICVSESVRDAVAGKLKEKFTDLGLQTVKNIPRPVRVFRVQGDDAGLDVLSDQAKAAPPRERRSLMLPAALAIAAVLGAGAAQFVLQKRKAIEPVTAVEPAASTKAERAEPAKLEAAASGTPSAGQSASAPPAAAEAKPASVAKTAPSAPEAAKAESKPAEMKTAAPPAAVASDAPSHGVTAGASMPEVKEAAKDKAQKESAPGSEVKAREVEEQVANLPDAKVDTAANARLNPIRWTKCLGEDAAAAAAACRALVADPGLTGADMARARLGLGLALRKLGDADTAITEFTKSIDANPTATALNERGIANVQKGHINDALADFDAAIKSDGKLGDAFNNRAYTFYKIGKRKEALADAERAVALLPDKAYVWDTRGAIQEAMGNTRDAIADYEKAISLDANLQSSKSALARLKGK